MSDRILQELLQEKAVLEIDRSFGKDVSKKLENINAQIDIFEKGLHGKNVMGNNALSVGIMEPVIFQN